MRGGELMRILSKTVTFWDKEQREKHIWSSNFFIEENLILIVVKIQMFGLLDLQTTDFIHLLSVYLTKNRAAFRALIAFLTMYIKGKNMFTTQ